MTLESDTAYLRTHCESAPVMAFLDVAGIFSEWTRLGRISRLAMSHERLRAEVNGLTIMVAELEKEIAALKGKS